MLFAVSGTQGSGKSTTLNILKQQGYNVVERKTSRSILSDWNVTLNDVNSNVELTMKFQDEITRRKVEDEIKLAESSEIWFTERTHTDLFVYTLVSIGKYNECSNWLDWYYNICASHNLLYTCNYCLPTGVFPIENDGVRGINKHYAMNVELVMQHYQSKMNAVRYQVTSSDPYERVSEILTHIREHYA